MNAAPLPLLAMCLSLLAGASAAFAQRPVGFGDRPNRDIVIPVFDDDDVARALATLDARLANAAPGAAERTYFEFTRYLQTGLLTAAQQTKVLSHLDGVERARPADAALLGRPRQIITTFTIGKIAPEIVGADLDGREFRLSDYRGKVVVLMFGGDWCGICKTEYPYLRLLDELYENWPFEIVGVNSDASQDVAREASKRRGLDYRVWWDGRGSKSTDGPIARAWQIVGWPTTYVIDAEGVIRFVDLRQDDLVRGVKQLMTELSRTLEKGTR
jgi:peroxiredoxin